MRILLAGIIARYPFGGVTWCSLMYLLGLKALGHEVFYIEDTGEGAFEWHTTSQPVTIDEWRTDTVPRDRFTTVMTWQIESFTDVGGNKDQEFIQYLDLPSRTSQAFELAINGPQGLLRDHGWATVD